MDQICAGIFDCPHSTPALTDSGPYVARSQDIRSGVFRAEDAARVSELNYKDRIARAEPRAGDLLFSREGTYFGIAAEVPPGMRLCLGQRMVLLRPSPARVHHRYLRYWLNSPFTATHVYGFRDGTVAERLNLPTIRALPVLLPPLPVQEQTARVLGALDDKIELNRQMNQTLEAMAQALFKSWFVDFDPVAAKATGRQPFGMDADTAALFPERFVDSDLGPIPIGWRIASVYEIANVVYGAPFSS
ncbi:MAG: restriction endonuclease subunit S, partial [bacterium]